MRQSTQWVIASNIGVARRMAARINAGVLGQIYESKQDAMSTFKFYPEELKARYRVFQIAKH